ncbi:type VI secretion system Vgr family protein [Cupriavidus sp. D384]|uniref:type VI secretion system Vgr family protein n=1 Tax=Cupriavidus sp. D384 TaxID=1538095 RepID=UPI0009EDA428|nr:type VI secretion system tip protein TssI/VgrG [Cupriavidus sp. D384]
MGGRDRSPLFSSRTVTVSGAGLPELLGQPLLVFSRLSGREGINTLFEYELVLKTPDDRNVIYGPAGNFDTEAMQGKELTVTIELDGNGFGLDGGFGKGEREITGVVTDVRGPFYAGNGQHIAYRLTLRPWLFLATLTTDYRIFQNKTVLEIAEELLSKYTFPVERRIATHVFPRREYQVQFGETDYAFLCRILAEWGINFHFEHSDGFHRLVLTEGNGAFQSMPSPAYQTISWYPSSDRVDEEHLYEFEVHDRLVSGAWMHDDYDFNQPRADLGVWTKDPRNTSHATQQIYAWPGDHSQPKTGNDARQEGDMLARIRMESLRQHGVRARGKGNLRCMVPGHTFALERFLQTKANREYIVYATHLLIEDVGEVTGAGQWRCEVEFEAQPSNELFRPEWHAKPLAAGYQYARVVGPENQEIWCDDLGRVKVQFPWDRYGKNNENSSCFLRTADSASGQRFGSTFVPRIGQEVLVAFMKASP